MNTLLYLLHWLAIENEALGLEHSYYATIALKKSETCVITIIVRGLTIKFSLKSIRVTYVIQWTRMHWVVSTSVLSSSRLDGSNACQCNKGESCILGSTTSFLGLRDDFWISFYAPPG